MATDAPLAFFSYCRADSEFALRLAEDLKAAGANVWLDQLDIEPGAPWDRAVEEALSNSPHLLVILSPVSVRSDNVRDEVSFALSRQKRVIPVLYRECDIPFRLARLQHIDFTADYDRGLKILLKALHVEQQSTAEDERKRAEGERKQEEQAEAQRLALIAEVERKQREEAEAARLAAEAERKQRVEVEAQRLAALEEAERKLQEQAEAARLAALAEAERRQREQAEAAQRAAESERKAKEEQTRQAELEWQRLAAERERQAAAESAQQEEPQRQPGAAERDRPEDEFKGALEQSPAKPRVVATTLFCVLAWDVCLYLSFSVASWVFWRNGGQLGVILGAILGCGVCFSVGTAATAVTARLSRLSSDWRGSLPFAYGWAAIVTVFVLIMNFLRLSLWYVVVVAAAGAITGALALRIPPFSTLFDKSRRTRIAIPSALALSWSLAYLFAGLGVALDIESRGNSGFRRFFDIHGILQISVSFDKYSFEIRHPYLAGSSIFSGLLIFLFLIGAICASGPCIVALWYIRKSDRASNCGTK